MTSRAQGAPGITRATLTRWQLLWSEDHPGNVQMKCLFTLSVQIQYFSWHSMTTYYSTRILLCWRFASALYNCEPSKFWRRLL